MAANSRIAMAVAGGYVLGRTKKAKLAITVAMLLAGRRLPTTTDGARKLLDSVPALGEVLNSQMRDELVRAARKAAVALVSHQADALAGQLQRRTERLQEGLGATDRVGDTARRGAKRFTGEDEDEQAGDERAGDEQESSGRRRVRPPRPSPRRRAEDTERPRAREDERGERDRRPPRRPRPDSARSRRSEGGDDDD